MGVEEVLHSHPYESLEGRNGGLPMEALKVCTGIPMEVFEGLHGLTYGSLEGVCVEEVLHV